jgi:hypothetical protein
MFASVLVGDTEALTGLDRFEGATVFSLVVFEKLLPVDGKGLRLLCGLITEWG